MGTAARPYGGVNAEDRRAARRERLIEAGLELLAERGWSGTTVRGVAFRSFAALVSEQGRSFHGADEVAEVDSELTAVALVGGLAELVVLRLDGSLAVSRERLVDHRARLFVASAQVSSRR